MTEAEIIAGRLTKAQKAALLSKPRAYDVLSDQSLYCVAPHVGTFNKLYFQGLTEIGSSNTVARLTPLGLAVRQVLQERGE